MDSIKSKNHGLALSRLNRCAIVMLCLLLVGCPATLNILFENSSDEEVELLQSYDGTLSTKIPAGTTVKTGTGYPSCLIIRSNSGLYEFHLIDTPDDDAYYDVGIFSVKTHVV